MEESSFTSWAELEEEIGARLEELSQPLGKPRMVALLIGRDNTELMKNKIVPSLTYFHERSSDFIDFYLVGWKKRQSPKGYLPYSPRIPDISKGVEETFSFDEKNFVKALAILEKYLEWKYSGELDLILFESLKNDRIIHLDFTASVNVQLSLRNRDGSISSIDGFIEGIIDFAKNSQSSSPVRSYLSQRLTATTAKGTYEAIVDLFPKPFQRLIRHITYLTPKNLESQDLRLISIHRKSEKRGMQF